MCSKGLLAIYNFGKITSSELHQKKKPGAD